MKKRTDHSSRSSEGLFPRFSKPLERAENYISLRAGMVERTFRHTYHAMPPVGWMNDPNGSCFALGKYHVFYQFHPYAAVWGPMHWGHFVSDDLVVWESLPVALAPDMPYDRDGCFSGSAIEKDGVMYLMYTAVADGKQLQALARSEDGVHFEKLGIVIGEEDTPRDCTQADFRDPYLFEREGKYYCLIGSKNVDGDANVLLYTSSDLLKWKLVGKTWKDGRTGSGIYECPSYAAFGETDALFLSPQYMKTDGVEHENIFCNLYMLGKLDLKCGAFCRTFESEIDGGFDFYAAQTLHAPDGRTLMTAWMQMWDRGFPTAAHGWAGALILPRELTLKEGRLLQAPVREIERYRTGKRFYPACDVDGELKLEGVEGDKIDLSFDLELCESARAGIKLFVGEGTETAVYYDVARGQVLFDRSRMGTLIKAAPSEQDASLRRVRIEPKEGRLHFRILLDVTSCEVFLGEGERTLTGNIYSPGKGIVFFSEGGRARILNVEKYDITVPQGTDKDA